MRRSAANRPCFVRGRHPKPAKKRSTAVQDIEHSLGVPCSLLYGLPACVSLITQRSVVQIHPPQPTFSTIYLLLPGRQRVDFPKNFPNKLRHMHCDDDRRDATFVPDIVDPPVGLRTPVVGSRRSYGSLRRVQGAASPARNHGLGLCGGLRNVLTMSSLLFSELQAAEYLQVSLSTLRRWRVIVLVNLQVFPSGCQSPYKLRPRRLSNTKMSDSRPQQPL